MAEGKPEGVQGLPLKIGIIRMIQVVSGEGMADVSHVHPDLMGASGIQNDPKERIALIGADGQALIMGDGVLSVKNIHAALEDGAVPAADGSVDGAGAVSKASGDHGQVFPVDFPALHLPGEDGAAQGIFGCDEEAGGVPVQAVDAPKDKGDSLLPVVPGQGIGQGVIVIAGGRVDGHICRFVKDDEILILIDDGKRQLYRGNVFGGKLLGKDCRKPVAGTEKGGRPGRHSVYHYGSFFTLHPGKKMPGKSAASQKVRDGFPGIFFSYDVSTDSLHKNSS